MTKVVMEERMINYVRNAVDLITGDTGYPVLLNTLTTSKVATREQVLHLAREGHILSVEVEIPSSIVKGSTVTVKGYYTERNVPSYVKSKVEGN